MSSRLEWRRDTAEVSRAEPPSGVRTPADAEDVVDGRYRIADLLGHGGLGVVFRAHDVWLDRPVALKLLQPANARDVEAIEAFKKEARVLARVRHDNVVQVYAFGPDRASFYLAMEYIAGKNLDRVIEEHAAAGTFVPLDRALDIIKQIGRGLAAVHARNIVHRDVKPANVVIDETTQRPVLVDFGLARRRSASNPKLSTTGGTPSYMAPEQATDASGGANVSARSDLYSLACTAFELLTGRPVFRGETALAVLAAHLKEPPPRISTFRPELASLDDVFLRALAKAPDERHAGCEAFVEELTTAALRVKRPSRPPPRRAPDTAVVRVVIWERDREFRRTIVRLVDSALTSPGDASEIECVADAAEFTSAIAREPAQLVIIDEESASSAAESAIRALRATPRGDDAEVLVLNRDWSLDASRLTALRATELPKPINPQVVRSVLGRMAAHIAERRKVASGARVEARPGDSDVLETQRVVLVVEDYEDMRILFAERIRAEGFDVITARDGAAAVDLAVRFRPKVVLMDLALPTIDGWEATRRIRRALGYGSGISPSIIAVSALDRDRDRADALRAGCDGFVAKPCSPEVVVSVVRTFMDAVS